MSLVCGGGFVFLCSIGIDVGGNVVIDNGLDFFKELILDGFLREWGFFVGICMSDLYSLIGNYNSFL